MVCNTYFYVVRGVLAVVNVFKERFGSIFIALVLLLVGCSIVVALQGFSIGLLVSLNLAVLGTVAMCRGLVEGDAGERRFYTVWSLVLYSFAVAIAISTLFSMLIGFAALLICLGLVMLFGVLH